MKNDRGPARLSVIGKLPEGYIILCELDGDEHSFLRRTLGISVECPHCGTTRCSTELAQEYFIARRTGSESPLDVMTRSHHVLLGPAE
jgi:hypothetical protein